MISLLSIVVNSTVAPPKHPAKKVTNALKRRDAKVFTTEGVSLGYFFNAPRDGWSAAAEIPFYSQVED